MIEVDCVNCGAKLTYPETEANRRTKCPSCGTLLQVPPPAGQPPAALHVEKTPEPVAPTPRRERSPAQKMLMGIGLVALGLFFSILCVWFGVKAIIGVIKGVPSGSGGWGGLFDSGMAGAGLILAILCFRSGFGYLPDVKILNRAILKQNVVLILLLLIGLGAIVAMVLHLVVEYAPPVTQYTIPDMRYDGLADTAEGFNKTKGVAEPVRLSWHPPAEEPDASDGSGGLVSESLAAQYTMSQAEPFTANVSRDVGGYDFQIAIYLDSPATAEFAIEQAYRRIEEIVENMSVRNKNGELARINSEAAEIPVKLSEDMYHVIDRARLVFKRSSQAYDITTGALRAVWDRAAQRGEMPLRAEKNAAIALIGFRNVEIDDKNRTIRFKKPGMMLDLTGALRGFACDQAAWVLKQHGVKKGFVRSQEVYHFIFPPEDPHPFRAAILHVIIDNAGRLQITTQYALDVDRPGFATVYPNLSPWVFGRNTVIPDILDGHNNDNKGEPMATANSCTIIGPDAMTSQMLTYAAMASGCDKARRLNTLVGKFNPEEEEEEESGEDEGEPNP